MIVKATNQQAHRMAQAGIQFVRLFTGCYDIDGKTTMGQLKQAGVSVRRIRNDRN